MNRVLTIIMLLVAITLCACKKPEPVKENTQRYTFRKDGKLSILSPQGEAKASFEIEIAETENTLKQGLKYRETMQPDQAMLFIFDGRQPYGFWMQDTYLPLDMLFIDEEGRIFQIEEHTKPFNEEMIEAEGFNKYTLEVLAGTCKRLGIEVGDSIKWERYK